MKQAFLVVALTLAAVGAVAIDRHEVVFTEGEPLRRDQGVEEEIFIGDTMLAGQTIVTGSGDSVELEAGTYKVRVSENTVFTLLEVQQGSSTQPVLAAALGKLSFARQRLGGSEPRLAGSSAICGVRGTEVTVLAGADGSTLFIVDEGAIEVTAAGATVALAKGEAVEVATGSAPGQKYQALSREVDYSKWNGDKVAAMLEDPVAAARNVEKQLDAYIEQIRILRPLYAQRYAELEKLRAQVRELARTDRAAAQEMNQNKALPLEGEAHEIFVNLRFQCLSALSLRRFVQGRLYVMAKTRFVAAPAPGDYQEFLTVHGRLLQKFETEVVPDLVEADI